MSWLSTVLDYAVGGLFGQFSLLVEFLASLVKGWIVNLFDTTMWYDWALGWVTSILTVLYGLFPLGMRDALHSFAGQFTEPSLVSKSMVIASWSLDQFIDVGVVFPALVIMLSLIWCAVLLRVLFYVAAVVWTNTN